MNPETKDKIRDEGVRLQRMLSSNGSDYSFKCFKGAMSSFQLGSYKDAIRCANEAANDLDGNFKPLRDRIQKWCESIQQALPPE